VHWILRIQRNWTVPKSVEEGRPEPKVLKEVRKAMSAAQRLMKRANRNACVGNENGVDVMIEDVADPDGRLYRVEIQSTPDGNHAIAWCRHNPWGGVNGGVGYTTGHVDSDGFICVGDQSIRALGESPYDLSYVITRVRYWATGFSVLKETGSFPNP
jgi:hypothetical protein